MDTYVVTFYPISKFIICLFAVVGFWGFLNNFVNKTLREQNIENNQEIHEINKRLDAIEKRLNNG